MLPAHRAQDAWRGQFGTFRAPLCHLWWVENRHPASSCRFGREHLKCTFQTTTEHVHNSAANNMTCRKRSLRDWIRSNLNNSLLQARWEGPHFSDLWTFAIGADASDLEAPETAVVRTRVVKRC